MRPHVVRAVLYDPGATRAGRRRRSRTKLRRGHEPPRADRGGPAMVTGRRHGRQRLRQASRSDRRQDRHRRVRAQAALRVVRRLQLAPVNGQRYVVARAGRGGRRRLAGPRRRSCAASSRGCSTSARPRSRPGRRRTDADDDPLPPTRARTASLARRCRRAWMEAFAPAQHVDPLLLLATVAADGLRAADDLLGDVRAAGAKRRRPQLLPQPSADRAGPRRWSA